MPRSMSSSPRTHKAAILAIILISYVMIGFDISVVLTGLPMIHAQPGFSEVNLAWVQSVYTLTFGGFLLLGALDQKASSFFDHRDPEMVKWLGTRKL